MSKEASDSKKDSSSYTKKQLSKLAAGDNPTSKKKGRRPTAWPSSPSESSSAAEEDEGSEEEDSAYARAEAKAYQREQRQYQRDRRAESGSRTGGGDRQDDGGHQDDGEDRGHQHHRDEQASHFNSSGPVNTALIRALDSLAKRFERPARPPAPLVPTFNDSCKSFPRFKKDIKSYFANFMPDRMKG